MKKDDKLIVGIICIVAFVIVSLPLFGNTLFAGHDLFFHTQRIWSIKHALEEGQFPVRIYKEIYNGYGYSTSMFYPELFLYLPAVLCMAGIPLLFSYNVLLLFVNALTIIIAVYSFYKITESLEIGTVAALLYVLCTYRMMDLYPRASLGEAIALTFCPLVLCGLTLIGRGEYKKWWILTLAFSGLLQSHILTFVLMVVLTGIYVIARFKTFFNRHAVTALCKAAGAAVLVNLWFLLPFLEAFRLNVTAMQGDSQFATTGAAFVQLFDILLLTICYGENYDGIIANEVPKTPGITLLAGAVLALFALILYKDKLGKHRKAIIGYLSAGTFALWMVTNRFPWGLLMKIGFLESFFSKYQFIWRYNIVVILLYSVAAAYGFYYFFLEDSKDSRKNLVLICLVLCGFSTIFMNRYIKEAAQYGNVQDTIESGRMDRLYVSADFPQELDGEIISNFEEVTYRDVVRGESEISFAFTVDNSQVSASEHNRGYLEVPITYYPGYKVLLNEQAVQGQMGEHGLIQINLPDGCMEGTVQVYFEEPILWKAANIASVVAAAGCVLYVLLVERKKNW